MNTSTRLLLTAIAAMINTFITLPLDVLSSKHVTASSSTATATATKEIRFVDCDDEPQQQQQQQQPGDDSNSSFEDDPDILSK